jgi:Rrf2 family protein
MLQLTKRTEYGLIALVHMVDRGGEFVSAREISDTYTIPKRLLAEVLKDLSRTGMVESHRGATGGYALARSAESITVGAVVAALEGAPTLASCGNDLIQKASSANGQQPSRSCEVEPVCPIRSPLQRIREGIWNQMEHTSLRSLVNPGPISVSASASPSNEDTANPLQDIGAVADDTETTKSSR